VKEVGVTDKHTLQKQEIFWPLVIVSIQIHELLCSALFCAGQYSLSTSTQLSASNKSDVATDPRKKEIIGLKACLTIPNPAGQKEWRAFFNQYAVILIVIEKPGLLGFWCSKENARCEKTRGGHEMHEER
jgi:hypothetical protein